MSQHRFLLSVLLVTATLSVCAAIKCAQCKSPQLTVVNGIVTAVPVEGSPDSGPELIEEPAEESNSTDGSIPLDSCEPTDCADPSHDACTYGHYEVTMQLDGILSKSPEEEGITEMPGLPSGMAFGMKQTWEKGCGTKSLDMCDAMEAFMKLMMKLAMPDEDKEKLNIEINACDIQTCDTDGCNSDKTKEDMGVADPISCYSCQISTPADDNQDDCEQTELCAEGVEQCFHLAMTATDNGQEVSIMKKSCANIESLMMALVDIDADESPGVIITSRSLKVCEGNLCSDYEEMNSAGINAPTLILLLISFCVTFLQLA